MKKNEITTGTTISQIEEIVASDIDGEAVMMSIENGEYYGRDARHIWHGGSAGLVSTLRCTQTWAHCNGYNTLPLNTIVIYFNHDKEGYTTI
jgi:hypothetical protein